MSYTEQETIENVITEIKASPEKLYAFDCVKNWTGVTSDTKTPYSEIAAREILKSIDRLKSIETATRTKSYDAGHNAEKDARKSNQNEKLLAKDWQANKKTFDKIGTIIDYEVPLKDIQKDPYGKIDLLSCTADKDVLYILELKWKKTEETLLRCILEIFTYWQTINRERLAGDFAENGKYEKNAVVRPGVLIFNGKDSQPYKEIENKEKYDSVLRLAKKLLFFTDGTSS